ncbi:MAG TPA: TetR/AcrR family transcriptional regulator, partial [Dehalococcoidia bacterium]|nr:TetR/AcrR family transcriptional regulator [Dehalococcoidia bacterium]
MNGFEKRKEEKKNGIRRAALDLFRNYGIKKITVSDVAKKAGVSPVTIYNYFGSKQGLIRDVVKWLLETIVSEYQTIIYSDRPYLKRWEQMLFQKGEIRHAYHGELLQTILSADPEIKQFVDAEMTGRIARLWIDLIDEGKREGFIRTEMTPEIILLYVEMFRSLVTNRPDLYTRLIEDDSLFHDFLWLFLYGLMGKVTEPDLLRVVDKGT